MLNHSTNHERTEEYLKNFDREKTLKFLIKNSKPTILDVGANVGSTLVEFKKWWNDSIVHCFEPQSECWNELEQQKANYPGSDVIINKFAVGNMANDNAVFYSHDITTGQSGFNKINTKSLDSIYLNELGGSENVSEYEQRLNHQRQVKIMRLDDYLREHNIQHIDLMKVDTQGFEPEVLEGMGDRLRDVDVVITELMFYDYYERSLSFSDIERFLLPSGFHLYDINHISKNPMNGRTDWVDVIYVNDRLRGSVK